MAQASTLKAASRQSCVNNSCSLGRYVMTACPGFTLFEKNEHKLLEQALKGVNKELLTSEHDEVKKMIKQRSSIAEKSEPDFVLVPISFFTEARCLPVLDNTCRLLGSKRDVQTEFERELQTLPPREKGRDGKDIDDETDIQDLQAITKVLAALLEKKLIDVWRVHNEHERCKRDSKKASSNAGQDDEIVQ